MPEPLAPAPARAVHADRASLPQADPASLLQADPAALHHAASAPLPRTDAEPLEAIVAPPAPVPRLAVWRVPVGHVPAPPAVRWSLLRAPAKLLAVAFLAYGMVFNFSVVRGSSMSPSIHDGDRILVDHLAYVLREVKRGDVVVLQYPLDPTLDYVKRVIGLPGDRVSIAGGQVYVNGKELEEPYVLEPDARSTILDECVKPDCYYVLGDNRRHSSDSREFGQVPRELLRGRVDLRVWPPSRLGVLD